MTVTFGLTFFHYWYYAGTWLFVENPVHQDLEVGLQMSGSCQILLLMLGFYFCSVIDFLLVTVATNQTDGFQRFMRSAKVYNIPVKVRCAYCVSSQKIPCCPLRTAVNVEDIQCYDCDIITRFLNVANAYSCTVIGIPAWKVVKSDYSKLLYGGQQRSLTG
jgi:hypothetical protein